MGEKGVTDDDRRIEPFIKQFTDYSVNAKKFVSLYGQPIFIQYPND